MKPTQLLATSIVLALAFTTHATEVQKTEEVIYCPIGILQATTKTDLEKDATAGGLMTLKKVKSEDASSQREYFSGEIKIKSAAGEEILVNVDLQPNYYSDDTTLIPNIYQAYVATNTTSSTGDVRQNMFSFLVLQDGISKGSGWSMGPKGSKQYKFMLPNSLSENPLVGSVFSTQWKTLNTKFGLKNSRVEASSYEVQEAAAKAVEANAIKEGSAVATVMTFGCWGGEIPATDDNK